MFIVKHLNIYYCETFLLSSFPNINLTLRCVRIFIIYSHKFYHFLTFAKTIIFPYKYTNNKYFRCYTNDVINRKNRYYIHKTITINAITTCIKTAIYLAV